jgi:O-antigen ligase
MTAAPPYLAGTTFRAPSDGTTGVRTWDPPWDALLVALAVYLLAAVGRIHQLFPPLLPLKPIFVASGAAIVLHFLLPTRRSGRDPMLALRPGPIRWMVLLLLWAILSIPGALWVGGAFQTVFDVLLKAVVMAVIVAGAVRSVGDVERLAGIYFAGIALYAAVVLSTFSVGGGDWRLNKLFYYDANDFATVAVTALPLGIYFALRGRGLLRRGAALVGLALTMTAFVWTGSRGGFIAAMVVGLFLLFGYSTIPFRWRLLTTGFAVVMLAATASDTYWEKMRSIFHPEDDYNLESHEGRKAIWTRGVGYMLTHPILGVGAGNFPTAEGTISPRASRQSVGRGVKWQAAHNSYVQVAAELGVPGLLCFLAMLGGALRAMLRRRRPRPDFAPPPDPRGRPLAQALAAALIAYATGALFLSLAYAEAPYMLVALAAGLTRIPTW